MAHRSSTEELQPRRPRSRELPRELLATWGALLGLTGVILKSHRAFAQPATPPPCSIVYSAPAECPGAAALAAEVGPHFRVIQGDAPCPTCVARVNITQGLDGVYVLQTGEEPTKNADCAELLRIAGFTVRSSHVHPEPVIDPQRLQPSSPRLPLLELGLDAAARYSRTAQLAVGAQVGVRPLPTWLLRPRADWTPSNSLDSAIDGSRLSHHGYVAGLDVCHDLRPWAAVCALGELQWFQVVPPADDWRAETARQVALGLGATFRLPLADPVSLQIQPAIMAVPRPARVRESDWLDPLYVATPFQAILRAAISWGIGQRETSEPVRANFTESSGADVTQ